MIYLDTSVALAALFGEPLQPPQWLWREPLIASRLLAVELMVRMHARGLGGVALEASRRLLDGVALVGLEERVLARALQPFPIALRTLDALHLSTIEFLRGEGQDITLATYDHRLGTAARALSIAIAEI